MFGALKFRDEFCFVAPGILPQLYAAGSTGGTAIPVAGAVPTTNAGVTTPGGNYNDLKKWTFVVQCGSGSANALYQAWIGGASASNGTFSMLPATSTTQFSNSGTYGFSAQSASNGIMVMEIRGEYISGLGSNVQWIKPIVSITNGSANVACLSLGGLSGVSPASLGDFNAGFVLAETDAF